MSIKIDWPVMSSVPDSLTLYWSPTPFTLDALPVNKVVLSPSAVTYTDTSVPNRTHRYYMLEAKKAGTNPQYSQCMIHGSWDKTGPGPQTIRRGDWKAGYFGLVTTAELFTVSQLAAAAGATSLPGLVADTVVTGWHKFVVDGKILFIPTKGFTTPTEGTWEKLYNLGLIYGVDGPGAAPFDLTTTRQPSDQTGYVIPVLVNQKKVITLGTDSFLVRTPRISPQPTDQFLTDRADTRGSEWWQTMLNMTTFIQAEDVPLLPTLKWWDHNTGNGTYVSCVTPYFSKFEYTQVIANASWSSILAVAIGRYSVTVTWLPVLEYIPE